MENIISPPKKLKKPKFVITIIDDENSSQTLAHLRLYNTDNLFSFKVYSNANTFIKECENQSNKYTFYLIDFCLSSNKEKGIKLGKSVLEHLKKVNPKVNPILFSGNIPNNIDYLTKYIKSERLFDRDIDLLEKIYHIFRNDALEILKIENNEKFIYIREIYNGLKILSDPNDMDITQLYESYSRNDGAFKNGTSKKLFITNSLLKIPFSRPRDYHLYTTEGTWVVNVSSEENIDLIKASFFYFKKFYDINNKIVGIEFLSDRKKSYKVILSNLDIPNFSFQINKLIKKCKSLSILEKDLLINFLIVRLSQLYTIQVVKAKELNTFIELINKDKTINIELVKQSLIQKIFEDFYLNNHLDFENLLKDLYLLNFPVINSQYYCKVVNNTDIDLNINDESKIIVELKNINDLEEIKINYLHKSKINFPEIYNINSCFKLVMFGPINNLSSATYFEQVLIDEYESL